MKGLPTVFRDEFREGHIRSLLTRHAAPLGRSNPTVFRLICKVVIRQP
jgi:hypothetical protein